VSKLRHVLAGLAALCFCGVVLARVGSPRLRLLFTFSQFVDLTLIFLLAAILATLWEILSRLGNTDG
jgi:hypothetical protein